MADDPAAVLDGRRAELEAELAALSAPAGEQGGISFGNRTALRSGPEQQIAGATR